ncbi:phasin family protein [Comamonadaceae bacterium G21597-S1]|nr:phasin family protein [Comamonadaceae bacterium G21597-S1]
MVKKLHKSGPSAQEAHVPLTGSVKDSAQQIWQAGLGAFAKAQAEGTRAFEALVKEGTALQRKTQAAAEDRITDATDRMTHMASDISSRATGHWDKLENIFEERVAKALNKLGVPSAKDVNALIARIDELKLSVQKLSGEQPAAAAAGKKATRRSKPAATAQSRAARKAPAKAAAKAVKTPTKRRAAAKRKPAGTSAAG